MRIATLVLALGIACAPAGAERLPDLGEASQAGFSPQQERALGERIMREIRASREYLDDPEIVDYLNSLGYRLVSVSPGASQPFEFFVIRDSTLNAFALPGGFIGVHTGLLRAAQSESEVAAVLGHEIAHVTQNHLARMIAGQSRTGLATLAALAVAILAARSNPEVAEAAIATSQAVAVQSQLDYSREHEREADRIGLQILQSAQFDPRAMAVFLDRLQKAGRVYENNAPAYLRTHPLTFERVADVQGRVESLPYRQVPDSLEFQFVRAKLQSEDGSPPDAVREFETRLQERKFASEASARYGLARARLRAKEFGAARKEWERVRALVPPHTMVEALGGEILISAGSLEEAIDHYQKALALFPNHRPLIYGYVEALLRRGKSERALEFALDRSLAFPGDPRLYEYQARAHAALGRPLQHHSAQAEAYLRRGYLLAAIEQLEIALKSGGGNFYQMSSVEARLRELRRLVVPEDRR